MVPGFGRLLLLAVLMQCTGTVGGHDRPGVRLRRLGWRVPNLLDDKEAPLGRLVINNAMTVNGAFEAPVPEPDGWLVLDADSNQVSLEQFLVADAMVLGRKTYEGLAAVWPRLADDPALGLFADRLNSMPKYVASRTLREPLAWNATLLEGDLADSVAAIKQRHGLLVVSGAGELAHALTTLGLVDEFWFWVSPSLWPAGPRIFDGVGPVRLELIGSTTFGTGVVRLAYRPAPDRQDGAAA
jgi:dihydrofolate reductase